jgi:hypothetical protein
MTFSLRTIAMTTAMPGLQGVGLESLPIRSDLPPDFAFTFACLAQLPEM